MNRHLIDAHADGDVDPTDGWAGWHLGSRVARVGSQGAVAAGCLVTVDTVTGESMMAWDTAAPLVRDADLVVTRFSRPVSTVAIERGEPSPNGCAKSVTVSPPRRVGIVPESVMRSTHPSALK